MSEFPHSEGAHLVAFTDDWQFRISNMVLEDGSEMPFVHLQVLKFTPSIFKDWKRRWKAFRASVSVPLFAMGQDDDKKWERFVRSAGFTYLSDIPCSDGQVRRLFVSYP